MPLYDFRCPNNHRFERMVKLANFDDQQFCSECSLPANRMISRPNFIVDSVDYNCPITGKHISSKRAHEDNLRKHDCRVLETGEKENNQRSRQKAEAEFDKRIEETVERTIDSMSSAKKEQLSNELINGGLTAEVARG